MLVERAELTIRPGKAEEFDAAMKEKGIPILKSVPGVRWVRFGRGVENPDKFILLAEWESMEAHAAYPQLPIRDEFIGVIAPYSIGGAMEHFDIDW